jgi:N6-L-threonylcarbamoyladenine synthase
MGLPYPGGPNLEKMADQCTFPEEAIERFTLPTPLKGRDGCDFSFSGLKTAVRNHIEALPEGDLKQKDMIELAYSFQNTVGIVLKDRVERAIKQFKADYRDLGHTPSFIVCGGVAANKHVRAILENLAVNEKMEFSAPPLNLCSDNGAMIAWAGLEKLKLGMVDNLSIAARPRWPLDPEAIAKPGGGVKA